jgi:hypothetical protein
VVAASIAVCLISAMKSYLAKTFNDLIVTTNLCFSDLNKKLIACASAGPFHVFLHGCFFA